MTITATFNSKGADGVIVAQGGDKQGYALYIRKGKLVLGVRDNWKLTEAVAGEPLNSGITQVTATISANGKIQLLVNEKIAATADAKCVWHSPVTGFRWAMTKSSQLVITPPRPFLGVSVNYDCSLSD